MNKTDLELHAKKSQTLLMAFELFISFYSTALVTATPILWEFFNLKRKNVNCVDQMPCD